MMTTRFDNDDLTTNYDRSAATVRKQSVDRFVRSMQSDGHLDLEGQRVLVNLADTEISYIIYIYIYIHIRDHERFFQER